MRRTTLWLGLIGTLLTSVPAYAGWLWNDAAAQGSCPGTYSACPNAPVNNLLIGGGIINAGGLDLIPPLTAPTPGQALLASTVIGGVPNLIQLGWGSGGGGGTPGGISGQVQYNNSGSFGGLTNTQLTALINPFSSSLAGLAPSSGGLGATYYLNAAGAYSVPAGSGGGTVNSVGFTAPAIFSVTGQPITGSGTIAMTLATETANFGFFGPATGSAAAPTFRAMVPADMPIFTSGAAGAVPASGGGTTNFLRADGTFAAPGGGGGSGTVSSGTGPAIAQYPSGTGTTVSPATVSGDATMAQGGALTVTKTGGVAFGPGATAAQYGSVITITAAGTWTKPTGAWTHATIYAYPGGTGGPAGFTCPATTNCSGSSGPGGSSVGYWDGPFSALPASLTISGGTAGTGGIAGGAAATLGVNMLVTGTGITFYGAAGAVGTIGIATTATVGGIGAGPTGPAGAYNSGSTANGTANCMYCGGTGGTSSAAGVSGGAQAALMGGTGGGSGGGIQSSGTVAGTGTNPGSSYAGVNSGSTPVATNGAAGITPINFAMGTGGYGGGAALTGTAGNGGAGGCPGGPGGAGGDAITGGTPGNGGAGCAGQVVIVLQ